MGKADLYHNILSIDLGHQYMKLVRHIGFTIFRRGAHGFKEQHAGSETRVKSVVVNDYKRMSATLRGRNAPWLHTEYRCISSVV